MLGTGTLVDTLGGPTDYQGLPPPAGASVPDQLDPVGFSTQLSDAAGGQDPAAFLALFAPELQEDAGRWYKNVRTQGVDRVLAVLRTDSSEQLQTETFDAVLQVGFHIPGIDGTEIRPRAPLTGMAIEPNRTPSTQYAVTVQRVEGGGVIQAWAPAGPPAPWDVHELVAAQGPGYVLATGAQNQSLLAEFEAPTARAADYTTNLFEELLPDLPGSGLDNPGFLLFVEPDDALFATYLVAGRTPGPISEVAGYAVAVPSASGDSAGSRVVMRPQPDPAVFASVAVHEFVHAMFHSTPNQSFLPAGHKDPGVAWISEGIARWIETHFTEAGFTGPNLQPEFGYPVAASVFEWLSETFSVATAFDAAASTRSVRRFLGQLGVVVAIEQSFPALSRVDHRD